MRSGVEVCEQDFLAETGGQDLAIVAGSYCTACVDGLDHATRLEGGLDISLVGHCEWSDALPPASLLDLDDFVGKIAVNEQSLSCRRPISEKAVGVPISELRIFGGGVANVEGFRLHMRRAVEKLQICLLKGLA
jgi:hypothetical protein